MFKSFTVIIVIVKEVSSVITLWWWQRQGGRWGRWQWCWKVTPTLLSCWYLLASCGNHSDFWVAVIFLLRPKKLKPEVEKRITLKQQQRQRAKAVSKLIVSGYRERGGSIISMLGVVQPPTSSDLFRSLQYSGSFRMNSTLWRFVPLLLLLGWVDFHVYRFQCKRRKQVSTSQAKKQREFVEQAKAAGLRSTWNWNDLRISPESPDLLADNQGGWYYHSDGIVGHVWGKAHSLKTCHALQHLKKGKTWK